MKASLYIDWFPVKLVSIPDVSQTCQSDLQDISY